MFQPSKSEQNSKQISLNIFRLFKFIHGRMSLKRGNSSTYTKGGKRGTIFQSSVVALDKVMGVQLKRYARVDHCIYVFYVFSLTILSRTLPNKVQSIHPFHPRISSYPHALSISCASGWILLIVKCSKAHCPPFLQIFTLTIN